MVDAHSQIDLQMYITEMATTSNPQMIGIRYLMEIVM
nr:MAG TPA: hypothetical protein [Caudoviricetes sp.]